MALLIPADLIDLIHAHGEASYPEEGAGLLLGAIDDSLKRVVEILPLNNSREDTARHNRYLLTTQDYLFGEQEADRLGLDVLGVFHSHPDHPNQPSEFDQEWAMPWFSYIITSVHRGVATDSRCWQLAEDRTRFVEESIQVLREPGSVLVADDKPHQL